MSALAWIGLGLLVAAAVVAGAALVGSRRFDRFAASKEARLFASAGSADLDRLPAIVRAFVERSGATGCAGPVRLTQRAEMRLQHNGAWIPVAATQTAGITTTGFVWKARANMGAFPETRVVDWYVEGEGALEARVAGIVRVAHASGPAATMGEAMRYLSELPWTPHAIACNRALAWRELGGGKVEVSTETPAGRAALVYSFDDKGDIATVAGKRPRDETGDLVPWEGAFSGYREIGGVRIPARGEVAWVEDGEPFAYFRGEIVALEIRQPDGGRAS